jgi:serine/threonine protein kinase
MIGRQLGGYRIESEIGRGGMGIVYLAEQIRLERKVALKVITPELAHDAGFRTRFERESRLAASIDHPNVVPVYEAGESEGLLYIAMRYVAGTDLKAVLTGGPLEPRRAAAVVAQVAAALDAAHSRGLVHRDVKPGNVLLESTTQGERAYLTDFGLTKRITSATGITKTGFVVR